MKVIFTSALICFIVCITPVAISQTQQQLKALYISKFLSYITWNHVSDDTLTIGVMDENNEICDFLHTKYNRSKHQNFVVTIKRYSDFQIVQGLDVVYISPSFNVKLSGHQASFPQKTLVITDGCYCNNISMIDFFMKDKSLLFNTNKSNIEKAGLRVNPNLIVLGNTDLDIRDLYKATEKTLNEEIERSKERVQIIEQQEQLIQELNTKSSLMDIKILKQDSLFAIQDMKLRDQQGKLTEREREIASKEHLLINLREQMNIKREELEKSNLHIESKEQELDERSRELKLIDVKIRQQQAIINKQNEQISETMSKIELQNQVTILFYSITALLLVVVVFLLYVYYRNKQTNRELALRNSKIEEQKREISASIDSLKSAQGQLVNSEKMASLGQLTAGIAHEINNPINFVSSGVNTLRQITDDMREIISLYQQSDPVSIDATKEKVSLLMREKEYDHAFSDADILFSSVTNGVSRTTEIVRGLRTFSRLDEDALKTTNVHEDIDSTLSLLKNKYKNRIEIIKDFGDISIVECFPGPMNQVYMNILNNAIDAIEGNGTISIQTRMTNIDKASYIAISIRDTGKGIAEENIDRIFEPFYTTKAVGSGTGLGLSISYGIVERHGGKITVESKEGKGTLFTIFLPTKPQQ